MLLTDARRPRARPDGELVLLADQDRSLWDRALIAEGQELVRRCLRANRPGPYQVQAAINAVHSDAATAADTDWAQIVPLYDQLLAITPSPVVALNRAVAVAEVDGPATGAGQVDDLDLARLPPVPRASAPTCGEVIAKAGGGARAAFLRRRRTGLRNWLPGRAAPSPGRGCWEAR